MKKETAIFQVINGIEGPSLYVGDENSGHRLAGPKPWGGGKTAHKFIVHIAELRRELDSLDEPKMWINPNDKTQAKFLPNIGESILFCHGGKVYYGKHTGGAFQCGHGVTSRYFNTWSCHWMYLPAACNEVAA